jgi:hypothetical protein
MCSSHKIGAEFLLGAVSVIFGGKIDSEVPVHKAWDFLIDINRFSACVPGI